MLTLPPGFDHSSALAQVDALAPSTCGTLPPVDSLPADDRRRCPRDETPRRSQVAGSAPGEPAVRRAHAALLRSHPVLVFSGLHGARLRHAAGTGAELRVLGRPSRADGGD